MKERTKGLYGLVLSGGRSSRMGRDKSLLEIFGIPQRDFVFQLITPFCEQVYTSVGAAATASGFKNPIRDQFSFGGPVNGILSALGLNSDVAWLTVPIDMPYVDQSIIEFLISNRDQSKMATCFRHKGSSHLQPLPTIWESKCRKPLLAFCQNGKSSLRQFLKTVSVHCVDITDDKVLTSVNSPADLEEFQQHLANHDKK